MTTWAWCLSPNLQIERDDPGNGASQRDGSFTGQRFAQHLDAAGSGPSVNDVDLRERNVRQLLVVPKQRRSWSEEADVKAVVPALAIQERDQLVQPGWAAAGAGKGETARSAIQHIGVADQDAERGAARYLLRDANGGFFHAGGAAIRTKQHAHPKSLAGSGFPFFEPRAFNGEGFAARNAFHSEGDAVHLGGFESIDEKACDN